MAAAQRDEFRQTEWKETLSPAEHSREPAGVDDAMQQLEELGPGQAKIELRYICGLSFEEAADVLDISPCTAKRDWSLAL